MPTLAVPMKPLADQAFIAQGKRLPVGWTQPTGVASAHFQLAFSKGDHQGEVDPSCYFRPASTNRFHVQQCQKIGVRFKEFTHAMLDGFQQALDAWRAQASLGAMPIVGPVVTGPAGSLLGPPLEPMILQMSLPQAVHEELRWRNAVASGLSQSFETWQSGVSVPGLPWYPLFALCPTPLAPPTPNLPMPLVMCTSGGLSAMSAPELESSMVSAFGGPGPDGQFTALAKAIGQAVSTSFNGWLTAQSIVGVIGTGTTPIVPGPVVGMTLPAPGALGA